MFMPREWEEGNRAYYEGVAIHDCPYDFGCVERDSWLDGFLFASAQDPVTGEAVK
jgi:ribosome modulation factor